jgi:two-component system chemotaxis response regulator CheB
VIRVLVVDDSAFARKVMREVLVADPRIEVVATARDGADAIEKIHELKPDVVTLDLVMPQIDGVAVLDALRTQPSPPRVIVVTMADADGPLGLAALEAGAFDLVHKPTAIATDRLYELGRELVEKVIAAGTASGPYSVPRPAPVIAPVVAAVRTPLRTKVVVVGASTGGPRALTQLLAALPKDMPVPIALVVHMPPGFTEAFARRLDAEDHLRVAEAADGALVEAGHVVVARAGIHLQLSRAGDACRVTLAMKPVDSAHRPSVDELFKSAARAYGSGVLGVVLTGMGADGLEGARAVKAAGGQVIVEDASTCVVYGMPRSVAEAGLADAKVPLDDMAAAIVSRL